MRKNEKRHTHTHAHTHRTHTCTCTHTHDSNVTLLYATYIDFDKVAGKEPELVDGHHAHGVALGLGVVLQLDVLGREEAP